MTSTFLPRWVHPHSATTRAVLSLFLPAAMHAAAIPEVQFNRDIRPIFADKCFACHGFDAKKRKGDLRLDTWEGATRESDEGLRAIVPGDLEKSEAWQCKS